MSKCEKIFIVGNEPHESDVLVYLVIPNALPEEILSIVIFCLTTASDGRARKTSL